MDRYNFVVYLQGEGENREEAERNALDAFVLDPGELTLVDEETDRNEILTTVSFLGGL